MRCVGAFAAAPAQHARTSDGVALGLLLVREAALAVARAAGKVAAGRPSQVAALHPLQSVRGLLLLAVTWRLLDETVF